MITTLTVKQSYPLWQASSAIKKESRKQCDFKTSFFLQEENKLEFREFEDLFGFYF